MPGRAIYVGGVAVHIVENRITYTCGMKVDFDGAPNAYSPPNSGLPELDSYQNAGRPGHWYGVVTNSDGTPIVQGPSDPFPGYWISQTSLNNHALPRTNPRRYVDSTKIPYVAVPPQLLDEEGLKLGDVAYVQNLKNGLSSAAVIADVGPHTHIGEGSVALCRALGLDAGRHGGASKGIAYTLYLASYSGWPRSFGDIIAQVALLSLA